MAQAHGFTKLKDNSLNILLLFIGCRVNNFGIVSFRIDPRSTCMATKTYNAGVKEYRQTYWMPEYAPLDTDILACFKITPQAGIDREEAAAAVAAESGRRRPRDRH